jgi:hypothetical protein
MAMVLVNVLQKDLRNWMSTDWVSPPHVTTSALEMVAHTGLLLAYGVMALRERSAIRSEEKANAK